MPELHHAGATIHYQVFGAGPPVLLFAPGFLRSRIARWRGNPARPEAAPPVEDPTRVLAESFTVIAMDQRNTGQSHAPIGPDDGWASYTADHLALLDHLGVGRCHLIGACIGVSFALALAAAAPARIGAMVLQNPIGLDGNAAVLRRLFDTWAGELGTRADARPDWLEAQWSRMFGGDFVFSVSRATVAACRQPMLLMPGNDTEHPAAISAELATLAPALEVMVPWQGPAFYASATARIRAFLAAH